VPTKQQEDLLAQKPNKTMRPNPIFAETNYRPRRQAAQAGNFL
jgi:hypothetical protein